MSQTIFKSSVQPLQNGSPFHSRSISQNYHVPHSFSPKPKETSSKPDQSTKNNSQTRIKKLSFLLSPNSENPMKSDDDRAPNSSSIVSFHTPSKSSGDMSKKFIQLKGSTSSNQLGFELFNSKDLVKLAMSKAKAKETTKKDRVRTPNNMSNLFKKPLNGHSSHGLAGSEKVEDLTHSFTGSIDHEGGGFRGARPSTSDKAAKMRRLNQIYNEGSPGDNRARQAQSIMYGGSNDLSHQFFNNSLSPVGHSVSKLLSPANMTVALSSDLYKLQGHSSSTRHKGNQDDNKPHRPRDEENPAPRTPIAETSSERFAQMKKVSSTHVMKTNNQASVNKFNFLNTPVNKERGRSPVERVRKIKLPFENTDDNIGRRNQGRDDLVELENAVNNLVRTCEASLEPHPRNKNAAEKMKIAQESVLERIRGLSKNEDGSQVNLEVVLKEKKAIEEELSAVKEENELLRVRMNEMCQRFKNNKMKLSGKEKNSEFVENVPSTKGETSDTGRATSLRKIINHQQRMIQDLKKKEGVVKKVLDMVRHAGMNVEDFSSSDNIDDENKEGCSVPAGSSSDLNDQKLTESEKMEQAAFQWNMQAGEIREITERDEQPVRSVIRIQNADQQGETDGESDDKMISGMRESENGSVRQKIVRPAYSDAKSTADSAGFSTRKQTKGRRSLSSKLKNKLKLDLTRVTGSLSVPKYNIVSGQSSNDKFMLNFPAESGKGFHEEFMSRFEEFSQSWRQAALHQKF